VAGIALFAVGREVSPELRATDAVVADKAKAVAATEGYDKELHLGMEMNGAGLLLRNLTTEDYRDCVLNLNSNSGYCIGSFGNYVSLPARQVVTFEWRDFTYDYERFDPHRFKIEDVGVQCFEPIQRVGWYRGLGF